MPPFYMSICISNLTEEKNKTPKQHCYSNANTGHIIRTMPCFQQISRCEISIWLKSNLLYKCDYKLIIPEGGRELST